MRGIADTAYAMREAVRGNMPCNWRTALLVGGCFEAHLVSTVSLMSFIFLPMLYGALTALGVPHFDHPLQRAIIDNMGRANLVLMVAIIIAHEVARSTCRRHLYGMRGPAIPCTPHGMLVHVASYLWLFLGVYFYTIMPMLVVIVKHAFNVRSTNYVVAEKVSRLAEVDGLPLSVSAGMTLGSGGNGARRK
jgi:hypothetical protein